MIIKVTDKNVFEDNPELKMIPQLAALSSDEVKYIAFVYDYESIYRRLPLSDRKLKVAKTVSKKYIKGGTLTASGKKLVELADAKYKDGLLAYKEMQYDEDREDLAAMDEQRKQYRDFLNKKDKDAEELIAAIKVQESFVKTAKLRKELLETIGARAEEWDEEEEEELTVIEKWRQQKDKERERQYQ